MLLHRPLCGFNRANNNQGKANCHTRESGDPFSFFLTAFSLQPEAVSQGVPVPSYYTRQTGGIIIERAAALCHFCGVSSQGGAARVTQANSHSLLEIARFVNGAFVQS